MKNYIFNMTLLFSITIAFQNCDDNNEEVYMWIAAERVNAIEPEGNVEQPFLLYKLKEMDAWVTLNENIIGFDYEEGYEYLLLVEISKIKKPYYGQHPERYTLLKIISKTKKEFK